MAGEVCWKRTFNNWASSSEHIWCKPWTCSFLALFRIYYLRKFLIPQIYGKAKSTIQWKKWLHFVWQEITFLLKISIILQFSMIFCCCWCKEYKKYISENLSLYENIRYNVSFQINRNSFLAFLILDLFERRYLQLISSCTSSSVPISKWRNIDKFKIF